MTSKKTVQGTDLFPLPTGPRLNACEPERSAPMERAVTATDKAADGGVMTGGERLIGFIAPSFSTT
jgi:hypothetical protein